MRSTTLRRLALGTVGLVALGVALTAVLPADVLDGVVAAAGNDYLVVAGVAALGLLAAFSRFYSGRTSNIQQASMPDPERPVRVRPLGDEFDETLSTLRLHVPVLGRTLRRECHANLREVAIRTLCRMDHCPRPEAVAHLERGDWTTNEAAAAFLREDEPPTPSVSTELESLLRGEPWFRVQACQTAEALLAFAETGVNGNGRASSAVASGGDR
jgi:hypothetical protein